MIGTKTCKRCGVERTVDRFAPEKRCRDGLSGICRECRNSEGRIWRANNIEKARQAARESQRRSRQENPEKHKAQSAIYRNAHREQRRAESLAWNAKNRERAQANKRRYHREHRDEQLALMREYVKEGRYIDRKRAYRAENRDVLNAKARAKYQADPSINNEKVMRRAAAKRRGKPMWVNLFFIQEAYRLARLRTAITGFKWHVDHIVPLHSPIVCGLHIENNLQVIPGAANIRKSNRHWPNMP